MSTEFFSYAEVPQQDKCKWFVRMGSTTKYNRGFRTKMQANDWINELGSRVIWRTGYVVRLRGVDQDLAIVNRQNEVAEP